METARPTEPTALGWIRRRTGAPRASKGRPSDRSMVGSRSVIGGRRVGGLVAERGRDGSGSIDNELDHALLVVAEDGRANAADREGCSDGAAVIADGGA